MGKKVFLFLIGLLGGFLLLISLSGVVSAQSVNCSDRGGFCGTIPRLLEVFDCCTGECAGGSCQCLSSICCKTSIAGNRGVGCYCEEECRVALTCIISTEGDYECCDDRAAWKRDAGVACHCHVECKSGQCIGGECFDPSPVGDTCGPAGCFCTRSPNECEFMAGGEVNSSLECSDPTARVCCCPLCGNGVVDIGEECDDGNRVSGDGCSASCDDEVGLPSPGCSNRGGDCDGNSDCCTGLICHQIMGGPIPSLSGRVCCNPSLDRPDGDGCLCPEECLNNNCFHLVCGGSSGPPPPPPPLNGNGNGNGSGEFTIGGNGEIINLRSPLGCTTTDVCISKMIGFLFSLVVILTPLMIILAGFLYITAVGKPEKIVQAQKLITWTLIGFLIVSLARAIIYVITSVIGG